MVDLLPYVCTSCHTVRAVVDSPVEGEACPVCAAVDSQQKLSVIVTRSDDDPPGVEVTFQILP